MRQITNPKMVKRNRTAGMILNLIGLSFALLSSVLAFTSQTTDFVLLYGLLLLAFVFFIVGNYFTNRFGRIPPSDEAIDNLLKGLDDKYTSIHFRLGYDHALFTPAGILAVVPKYEHGLVEYTKKKKWKQSGVSTLRKFFGSETVGDLGFDGTDAAEQLAQKLKKLLKTEEAPLVRPVVVFVNEGTKVSAGDAQIPVLPAAKFKEFVRKLEKKTNITPEQLRVVLEFCGEKP
jgi:hypothetical protein